MQEHARRNHLPPRIHHHIEQYAVTQPNSVAASFLDERLTYAELNCRANQVASYLIQNGAAPGKAVAVCLQPSVDVLICLLGILKTGAAYVPLDPTYPTDRLAVILEDTKPCQVLTQSALASLLPPLRPAVLCVDGNRSTLESLPATNADVEIAPDQAAVIIYTSGTTGTPKGVVLSHANLSHYIGVAREHYGFSHSDIMPAMARFSFSISLFELLCPLLSGGQVIILEREHVIDFKRLMHTMRQATVMHASPNLWRKLLAYCHDRGVPGNSFSKLRHISSGGDMVSADLIESFKRVFETAEIFVIYGCSEIGCMGCTYLAPRDRTVTRSLVGKPFDNVSVRLLDEQQHPVPIGTPGEVYFGGGGVALGYLNREALTGERFARIDGQRFYRTGDIGRFDNDGNLELLGRSDFQVKLRGIRIELGEIETVLRQVPGVRESVVAARQLENEETLLVAYVVMAPAHASTPRLQEVRHFLRAKLPDYMVPGAFVVLDALPVNLNQKIDRRALPLPTAEHFSQFSTVIPPRNAVERRLATVWQSVLGHAPIGIRDSFFDVGGDSLLSLSLMMEIERNFSTTLPISSILTECTIEKQAALIESGQAVRTSSVLLRPGNSGPPLFLIHDGDGEVLPYRNLAFHLKPAHPVYGLQPRGSTRYPILHTRLGEIVDHYTTQIRDIQPSGPYFFGGLCIGGFIAFEIARKLRQSGERVGMVALIDAAHVRAVPISLSSQRLRRFSALIRQERTGTGIALRQALRKIFNAASYEIRSRIKRSRNRVKLELLRYCLDHDYPLPAFLRGIPVAEVLRFAEKEYQVPAQYAGDVVLLRASIKDSRLDGTLIDDTPYVELFSERTLGWDQRSSGLKVHDLPGGHSSMLQEPHVTALAHLIQSYMDASMVSAAIE